MIRAIECSASRGFIPYSLTVPSLRAAHAVPMVPVGISGLEVRYVNLSRADGERPPQCRAPNFKKPRGRPKRRFASQVTKEHALLTQWALSWRLTACRGVTDVYSHITLLHVARRAVAAVCLNSERYSFTRFPSSYSRSAIFRGASRYPTVIVGLPLRKGRSKYRMC